MSQRRVGVTGMGLVSPLGIGVDQNWSRLRAGESGIGTITKFDTSEFPTKIAGEVRDFEPTKWIQKKLTRQMDIFIQYAVAASYEAMASAKLDGEHGVDPERIGVFVGAGLGGITTLEETKAKLIEKGPAARSAPTSFLRSL